MTSRDFGFLTLRNTTAYQPNGLPVPPNRVLVTSTNGAGVFSNSVNLSTIDVSTLNTHQMDASTIQADTLSASTISTNLITMNNGIINGVSTINGVVYPPPSGSGYWAPNGNNIYNTNSGNVGIGKSNPLAKLDVNGSINSNGYISTTGNINLSNGGFLNAYNTSNTVTIFLNGQTGDINANGNITTNKDINTYSSINVFNNSSRTIAITGQDGSINAAGHITTSIISTTTISTTTLNANGNINTNGNLTVGNGIIVNSGNVGIGNPNPYYKLDITGDVQLYDTTQTKLAFTNAGLEWDIYATSTFFGIESYKGSPYRVMTLLSTGQVGIGTNNPQATLDVNGQIRVNQGTAADPGIYFSTDTNTGLYGVGDGQMGLSANGEQRMLITDTDVSIIPSTTSNLLLYNTTPNGDLGLYINNFGSNNTSCKISLKHGNTSEWALFGNKDTAGAPGYGTIASTFQIFSFFGGSGDKNVLTIYPSGNTDINGDLTVNGTSVSRVSTTSIGTDPGSSGWTSYYGKYCFVDGTSVGTLTLPIGGNVPSDGTTLLIRNISGTTPITINNSIGGASILADKTISYVYTTSVTPNGWYSLFN